MLHLLSSITLHCFELHCLYTCSDPVIKAELQLKIEEKNGELENAKCERNEAEDKSYDKVVRRGNKVVDSNQEEVHKANVMVSYSVSL